MFQVRIHGRGGQGVVTGAEMLSIAAFLEGKHAQAFPSFGSERTGAPVVAFCRIDSKEIRLREPIMAPDAIIIQDPTLLHQVDVFQGLKDEGYVLINTAKSFEDLDIGEVAARLRPERYACVPATEIALKHLGRPLPNAVLLGAFAGLAGQISLPAVVSAIRDKFSGKVAEGNIAAATAAFEQVRGQLSSLVLAGSSAPQGPGASPTPAAKARESAARGPLAPLAAPGPVAPGAAASNPDRAPAAHRQEVR
jgi:pyruvate ferredoxin oxidoreductase gamma subunit